MSMIGYVEALSPAQIQAFQATPSLASDFAAVGALDVVEGRLEARFKNLPPEVRAQYQASKKELAAQISGGADYAAASQAARQALKPLAPFADILDLDKDWHILHYVISGHAWDSSSPEDALLGGEPIGDDLGYGPARLHHPSATRAFADFLAPLDADRVVARADFPKMGALQIYGLPPDLNEEDEREGRDDIRRRYTALKDYVTTAARAGSGLLVWLS